MQQPLMYKLPVLANCLPEMVWSGHLPPFHVFNEPNLLFCFQNMINIHMHVVLSIPLLRHIKFIRA